jgi:hypothetical protein
MLFKEEFIEDLNEAKLRQEYPTIKLVGRWYDGILRDYENGVPLEAQRYGPLKRIRRRYQEYINEDFLPSVTVDDLDLSPLYR